MEQLQRLIERIETKKATLKQIKEKAETLEMIKTIDFYGEHYGALHDDVKLLEGEIQGLETALRIVAPRSTEKDLAAELFGEVE